MTFRPNTTITPIGCTMDWFGSITGCPILPDGWQLCDGTQITDQRSPMYLSYTPTLNSGGNRMLRGNTTSGSVGGADTHVLAESEMPSHTHSFSPAKVVGSGATLSYPFAGFDIAEVTPVVGTTGGGNAHNNLPGYTDAIKIMRIF